MRYDRLAAFYSGDEPVYNPATGKYDGGPKLAATIVANVNEVGTDRQAATFGDIDQTNLTVRLIAPPPASWSYLKLNGDERKYKLTTSRSYRHATTLIVGEVK